MDTLNHEQITSLFLALGILLAAAKILGELATRFKQPSVLGEILAGILLGPTVLGTLAPRVSAYLFPTQGTGALVLDGIMTLAIVLFLLVAGLEVELSSIWRQGKAVLTVGLAGIAVPFALGFTAAELAPKLLGSTAGEAAGSHPLIFPLFFATALSISALPVIAKTLMDLNLYRSDLGMMTIAAAVFNDLLGWIIFAIVLGMMGASSAQTFSVGQTIGLVLLFALVCLTLLRWGIHRLLPWIQAHTSWPGGVLGFALSLALLGAALTEWLGVHAIFGSFLVGVALGDSPHFRRRIRAVIDQFVSFIFAPLFFAGIGLKVNFLLHFQPGLVLAVLLIACAGKIFGCWFGGRIAGMAPREAWALGFTMNARGAMEIILGLVALRYGVIGEPMFVALVVMALVTSLLTGPALTRILRLRHPCRLSDYLSSRGFFTLTAGDRETALREMAAAVAQPTGLDARVVAETILARERQMSTGLGHGVAVPHARLPDLESPFVAVGLSPAGIDFEAPDGLPAQIIFLILTPREDQGAQLEILAEISRLCRQPEVRQKIMQTGNFTEFLALVNTR
ncbi:MAG: cation:proton antiporter [Desulfuromonadales bacterium]|nr:cation:proton antiporter [Desulfuromonadales bacterium]